MAESSDRNRGLRLLGEPDDHCRIHVDVEPAPVDPGVYLHRRQSGHMEQCRKKMVARVEELPAGLVIEGGPLEGVHVEGWDDHRVVMALACAGMVARGETSISTAESVAVTFPNFVELMRQCGANIENV